MIRLSVGLVAAVSIAGCMDVRTAMERFTPAEADSVARQMIGLAASGATEEMLDLLAPEVRGAEARQGLEQIGAALGGRTLREIELIRSEVGFTNGRRIQQLTYEGRLDHEWMLAQFTLIGRDGGYSPIAFLVNVLPRSQREINGFRANLRPLQGAWLLLASGSLGVVVLAVVRVLRSRLRRRWLWMMVSTIALVRVTINWTTGHVSVQPFAFQLFGVGIWRSGLYGPFQLTWAVPVGALWALWSVRRSGGGPAASRREREQSGANRAAAPGA